MVTKASAVLSLQRLFMRFLPKHRERYQIAPLAIIDPCHSERQQNSKRLSRISPFSTRLISDTNDEDRSMVAL
jgi:hypothetical protein